MIPPREQLPKSWKGLKRYRFDLPRLIPDDPSACPVTKAKMLEYLDMEAPGGAQSGSSDVIRVELHFVRTAVLNDSKYWLWSFTADDARDCYVAVQETRDGGSILGFDEMFGLTPEQWLVLDFYGDEDWEDEG